MAVKEASSTANLSVARYLCWRPVSSAPIRRPPYAVVGGFDAGDKQYLDIASRALGQSTLHEALVEARYAGRYDGLMILDVYVNGAHDDLKRGALELIPENNDEDKLTNEKIRRVNERGRLSRIEQIAECCAHVAKSQLGHKHHFHLARGEPVDPPSKRMAQLLWLFRAMLLACLITGALSFFWPVLFSIEPESSRPDFLTEVSELLSRPAQNKWLFLGLGSAIALVAEVLWAKARSGIRQRLDFGGVSFNVLVEHVAPGMDLDGIGFKQLRKCARQTAGDDRTSGLDEDFETWITDKWLLSLNAFRPQGGRENRQALVQLRRQFLKAVEHVCLLVSESVASERKQERFYSTPLLLRIGALQVVFVTIFVVAALLHSQRWMSLGVLLVFGWPAILCVAMFTHSLWLVTTRVKERVEFLRSARGIFAYANALGEVIRLVFLSGQRGGGRSFALPASSADRVAVDSFHASADTIQVMLDQDMQKQQVLQFRAGLAAAVLALLTPMIFDRLKDVVGPPSGAAEISKIDAQADVTNISIAKDRQPFPVNLLSWVQAAFLSEPSDR